ncbi:hypothetical protein CDQ68_02415 [Campylobacter hyointestinalis subsp. hyointestinalis]|nr:hypothetical protein CDQ68_02415 [Campylobacter hyointestinalis subsp. hyointestinalis]
MRKDMFILWLKKILNKIPFIKKIVLICFYFIVNFKNNFTMFKYYFYNYFLSYYPSYHIRHWYLKYILHIKLQDRCFVHLGCYFYGSNIEIGKGSVIGRHCQLCGDIKIGNNCSITAYSFLQSISHDKNSPTFECCSSKIIIQDYVWLGAYSMVLCGGGGLVKICELQQVL